MAEQTEQAPADTPERGVGGVAALLRETMRQSEGEETPDETDGELEETQELDDDTGAGAPTGGDTKESTDDDTDDAGGGDTDEGLAAASLSDLAKQAGVSIESLYDVAIPLGDERDPTTLGAMKDRFNELLRVDQLHGELETQRTDFENSMIRARSELNEIVGLLPQIPQELLERAQSQHRATREAEREALIQIKPEWRDDQKFEAAQGEILEAIGTYGFGRTDLDLVLDHRLVKLLHDFAGMKRRLAAADVGAKQVRETGRLQKSKAKAATKKQAKTGELSKLTERAKGGDREAMGQAVQRVLDDAGMRNR